jgi:hypothetical protein
MELMYERMPINLTLIMPGYIDTPLFINSRSKLGVKPRPVPPVYAPEVVVEAILFAAEHRRRDMLVGGQAAFVNLLQRISPPLVDRLMVMRGLMFEQQKTNQPDDGFDNLFQPTRGTGSIRGEWSEIALPRSAYTRYLEFHPYLKGLLAAGLGWCLFRLARRQPH